MIQFANRLFLIWINNEAGFHLGLVTPRSFKKCDSDGLERTPFRHILVTLI